MDVAVHFSPERPISSGFSIEILDDDDGWLGTVVYVGVVAFPHDSRFVAGKVGRMHGANDRGARIADHGAQFGTGADQWFHRVAIAPPSRGNHFQRVAYCWRIERPQGIKHAFIEFRHRRFLSRMNALWYSGRRRIGKPRCRWSRRGIDPSLQLAEGGESRRAAYDLRPRREPEGHRGIQLCDYDSG